ncbi:DUF3422 family protein [Microvirga tunisiensis]|uniref:DUF3422 family protein n=1 Tax=Pannonibacter tanglangensis TaxID=2750084 RepID=A0A7X5F3I4_9HYPH|nr:DUF3422 domain-containing protein [Pannonibacter sp. XCT-53]NBN79048.1 DUF3422 family protein [Pannonibacter sp. XCT-53]
MTGPDGTAASGTRLPSFERHPLRAAVLGEIHARPFRPLESPRLVLHFAFTVDPDGARQDRAWYAGLCASHGTAGPGESDRSHVLPIAGGLLRWEQHAEFITYTFDAAPVGEHPFGPAPAGNPFGAEFRAPGPMLAAARLDVVEAPGLEEFDLARWFDPASLAALQSEEGRATAVTDFRQDGDGLTRILLVNSGMGASQTGALAQRLIEVETYRTLALMGLPMAMQHAPDVRRIEQALVKLTNGMRNANGIEHNRELLEQLSGLAADLEAGAAASAYRFGASRAYHDIVQARLGTIDEAPVPGLLAMSSFLARRLAPAMRTIQSLEERQNNLSRKLARASTLLRTRVDVDMERQNRDLLDSMNQRARMQLRLQQTVEGLSVAAVSYYVVGLVGYLAKGLSEAGLPIPDPGLVAGVSVPLVVLAIWWTMRRIRAYHADPDETRPEEKGPDAKRP